MRTKIDGYSVYIRYDNGAVKIGDTTSLTLPSIERLTDSISGAGIAGEIDVPSVNQFASMETEITIRVTSKEHALLMNANQLEYRWLTNNIDTSNVKQTQIGNKAFLTVILKKADEGKIEQGSAQDATFTYEVVAYKRISDGEEIFNIDKLNGVFTINGVNQLGEMSSFL